MKQCTFYMYIKPKNVNNKINKEKRGYNTMSNFNKEYEKIITQIEQSISNEKERKNVKEKVADLSMLFYGLIDNINTVLEERIVKIEEKQNNINSKFESLKKSIDEIEADIYDEEESEFDFEIVCPYCNNEFITDLNMMNEEKTEIRCPECSNIIELDWNDEEEETCSGHCGSCHGCDGEEEYEDAEEENEDDM